MNLKRTVLLISTALFFLCGCAQKETLAVKAEKQKEDPVSLSWYINYSWFATKWGGNVVSDHITEKTGSTIEFIAPKGSEDEKLRALMAADNLPDFVTISWENPLVKELVEKDMVYPLNELADLYAPQFYESADACADG